MRWRGRITGLLAVALALTGCGAQPADEVLSFGADPQTVLFTNPIAVGETYTVGMTGPDEDAERPVRITSIEVLRSSGVEVIGIGAFDPVELGSGIGLVAGWPPIGYDLRVRDETTLTEEWPGDVYTTIGVRTLEPRSGLRGILVRWVDADGVSGSRAFDLAVLTCAAEACTAAMLEDHDLLLSELGLVDPAR
ncbi:MAG: hypothetical protein M3395_00160 [Chloroflexota bacterium]|nr:hypothetical protein [Chloroflexota bacterium]